MRIVRVKCVCRNWILGSNVISSVVNPSQWSFSHGRIRYSALSEEASLGTPSEVSDSTLQNQEHNQH